MTLLNGAMAIHFSRGQRVYVFVSKMITPEVRVGLSSYWGHWKEDERLGVKYER